MADNIPDKYGYLIIYCTESTRDEGIPLTVEGEQEDDEHLNEIEVNQRNGVDAFEGDIMMTAEQYEELKKEFEQTGQTLPQY